MATQNSVIGEVLASRREAEVEVSKCLESLDAALSRNKKACSDVAQAITEEGRFSPDGFWRNYNLVCCRLEAVEVLSSFWSDSTELHNVHVEACNR